MASFVVDNNVESTVADNPLAQSATTLNVAVGEGANFPSTFPFRLTIWDEDAYQDPTDDSGMEIVECTARATDALTIARGKEGTGDVAHANGERVAILITAGLFNDATYGITTKLDGIEASADVTDATNVRSAGADIIKRTAVGAGNYNPSILTTDYIIAVDNTAAARSVIISTEDIQSGTATDPRIIHVVDESGGAGTNNITVTLENAGTINGASSAVIISDYNAISIYLTGTNGFIY